jgi:hypothetical protein
MEIDFLVSEDNLLERVDEYTLYCHYLEYEPEIRVNYNSPFRNDDQSPSFGIYPCRKPNRELMWKDSGGLGESGDIFLLVKKLYGYQTKAEAIARIKSDFGLGPRVAKTEKIVRHVAKQRSDADLRVRCREFRSEDFSWWSQFNITADILKRYRVSALFCYWLSLTHKTPVFAPPLSYVYRIYDRYQLYFPTKEKGKKFRMDLQEHHVMGLEQLERKSDTLIITKSYKDVMCLKSFGYEAVSPRSENTPMPDVFFAWADQNYKRKLVLFDNDMKHRGEWYPYQKIYVPVETGSKDPSDHCRDHGPQQTATMLKYIIGL